MNQKNKSRKNAKAGTRPAKSAQHRQELELHPSFKGQPCAAFKVHGGPHLLTTTVTTGVVAAVTAIDPVADVVDWATRFGAMWREYRVVKAILEIELFSTTNSGILSYYPEEVTSSAPSAATMNHVTCKRISCADVTKRHRHEWVPSGPSDLAYLQSTVSSAAAYFKIYTDTANFGSPAVVTVLGIYTVTYTIQAREFI